MRIPTDQRFERVKELAARTSKKWSAIDEAITTTERDLTELERLLLTTDGRPLAENVSLVFFGSLARGESTSQSDIDWTLLINGEVDVQHFVIHQVIRKKLRDAGKIGPGAIGTFGGLAFSHDLVHCIGGQDDTNKNLTLRMLLLLESLSLGDDDSRKMVIRAILRRYLADDPSWTWKPERKLPRFLLNDIIRFWRTMAVDFADKFHDQEGEKWALRNAKLRFSRKLILLTGIFACFSWRLHGLDSSTPETDRTVDKAIAYFESYFSRAPLEILADEFPRLKAPTATCDAAFSAYDEFLAIIADKDARNELQTIPRELADKSQVFQRIRKLSHEFRDSLLDWMHMTDTPIFELVKQYALF